jgi:hypothetical protein
METDLVTDIRGKIGNYNVDFLKGRILSFYLYKIVVWFLANDAPTKCLLYKMLILL